MESFKINKKTESFPLNLPIFNENQLIDLSDSVIIFAGDNGAGKSTILDIIAYFSNCNRIASESGYKSNEFKMLKSLKSNLTININYYRNKFYFRSEDFITYIHFLHKEKDYSFQEIERVKEEYKNKSVFAQNQALAPFSRTIAEINHLYEKDLLEESHGQSYIDFFSSRLRKDTFFILDEPESALSFNSLLILMSLIKQYKDLNCKFIIATHSPVLLAFEGAVIYQIQDDQIKRSSYEELDQIITLKNFLKNPQSYLKYL